MPSIKNNETLDAFRGIARRKSFSQDRQSGGEPKRLGTFAASLFRRISKLAESKGAFESVSANWDTCIPPKFNGRCAPLNIKLGTLFVSVENPSARQELSFMERRILEAIRKLPECDKVRKIRFI